MRCAHDNLQFERGGYYVICQDCGRRWVALMPRLIEDEPNDGDVDPTADLNYAHGTRVNVATATCENCRWFKQLNGEDSARRCALGLCLHDGRPGPAHRLGCRLYEREPVDRAL